MIDLDSESPNLHHQCSQISLSFFCCWRRLRFAKVEGLKAEVCWLADFMLGGMCLKPCGSNDSGKNCNFSKLYLLGSKNVESQIPKFIGLDSEIFSLGESWGDFSWQLPRFYVFGELSSGQKWQKWGVILGIFLASAHRIQESEVARFSTCTKLGPPAKTPVV